MKTKEKTKKFIEIYKTEYLLCFDEPLIMYGYHKKKKGTDVFIMQAIRHTNYKNPYLCAKIDERKKLKLDTDDMDVKSAFVKPSDGRKWYICDFKYNQSVVVNPIGSNELNNLEFFTDKLETAKNYFPSNGLYLELDEDIDEKIEQADKLKIHIGENWDSYHFSDLFKKYSSTYTLLHAIESGDISHHPLKDALSHLWLKNNAYNKIPIHERPIVTKTVHASPGYIIFNGNQNINNIIKKMLLQLEKNYNLSFNLYNKVQTFLKEKELSKMNVQEYQNDNEHDEILRTYLIDLDNSLNLNVSINLLKACNGNTLEALQIMKNLVKKINDLAVFIFSGRIDLSKGFD